MNGLAGMNANTALMGTIRMKSHTAHATFVLLVSSASLLLNKVLATRWKPVKIVHQGNLWEV
jgi:hypothetical protein